MLKVSTTRNTLLNLCLKSRVATSLTVDTAVAFTNGLTVVFMKVTSTWKEKKVLELSLSRMDHFFKFIESYLFHFNLSIVVKKFKPINMSYHNELFIS